MNNLNLYEEVKELKEYGLSPEARMVSTLWLSEGYFKTWIFWKTFCDYRFKILSTAPMLAAISLLLSKQTFASSIFF